MHPLPLDLASAISKWFMKLETVDFYKYDDFRME